MCLKLSVGIGLVMNMLSVVKSLMRCFPYSFINCMGEFVAQKYADGYFKLDDCKTEEDVKYKVLAYLSRSACKSTPYYSNKKNNELHKFMLDGINTFLGTSFTKDDMYTIYTFFGNGCNKDRCYEFIRRGYDMGIFEEM